MNSSSPSSPRQNSTAPVSSSSRREFLGRSLAAAGGAISVPYFVTSAAGQPSPGDRPVIGCIGVGSRGMDILHQSRRFADIAAVCDVDAGHARAANEAVGGKADVYEDYRRVLERKDIQAVTVVTPDHWHSKIAIEAMQAGKDLYCEKPLTLTIEEGRQLCAVAKQTGRIVQVGTQQRSEFDRRFLTAVALVRAGRLGKVSRVSCAIGAPPSSPVIPVVDVPKELNWERWLGQAPLTELRSLSQPKTAEFGQGYYSRCHYEFRWWLEYSGGKLTDWGAHHVDIAAWALGLDQTGPTKVKPISSKFPVPMKDGYPTLDDRYNTPTEFNVVAQFANEGVEMTIRHDTDNGILFEGEKGRIFVNRDRLSGKPAEELAENPLPEGALEEVYKGKPLTSHMANYFDCLKSRQEPISDVWSHHKALTICHLANIALRLDREITWDPAAEKIVGDEQAQSFVGRQQRKGYEIVV